MNLKLKYLIILFIIDQYETFTPIMIYLISLDGCHKTCTIILLLRYCFQPVCFCRRTGYTGGRSSWFLVLLFLNCRFCSRFARFRPLPPGMTSNFRREASASSKGPALRSLRSRISIPQKPCRRHLYQPSSRLLEVLRKYRACSSANLCQSRRPSISPLVPNEPASLYTRISLEAKH